MALARRAARGDDSGVRAFRTAQTQESWELLSRERESLVWRHVARARGLLAPVDHEWADEIERDLSHDTLADRMAEEGYGRSDKATGADVLARLKNQSQS